MIKSRPEIQTRYRDPHQYPEGVAFQDGQYIPVAEAKISVVDYGFLHSDATYDTVSVWNGAFFRLDLHLDRFFSSMEKLSLSIGYTRDELTEILMNCVALSGLKRAYVEMICTRGCSPSFSRDPRDAVNRFLAFAIPLGFIANDKQMEEGLHIVISDIVRIPSESVNSSIKNYHWLDLVIGLMQGYEKSGDTVLLSDMHGNITEGPGFNVFVVKGGVLSTPHTGVLHGITRQTVFDLCETLSHEVQCREVCRSELTQADEIFITSTAGGIMPVTRVDNCPVSNGEVGPITEELRSLYWARHEYGQWITPIEYL
ncbi:MAG: aminotransferase class IV [Acidiferrobacterales bacterium]|nr:aminotransferase class IV [Acidiferrobacterales bacterium]